MLTVYHTNQDHVAHFGQVDSLVLAKSRAAAARAIGCSDRMLKDWGGTLRDDHPDAISCIRAGEGVVLFRPNKASFHSHLRRKDTQEFWTPYAPIPEGGYSMITMWARTTADEGEHIVLRRVVREEDNVNVADDIRTVSKAELFKAFWPDLPLDDD